MSARPTIDLRLADLVVLVLRLGLGGLLAVAGILKLDDPARFAVEIANYQLLPGVSPYLAATLPTSELLLGLGLIASPPRWRRPAALGALLFFTAFLVAVSSAVLRHVNISCGCFGGSGGGGGDVVSRLTIVRNLSLVAATGLLLRLDGSRSGIGDR